MSSKPVVMIRKSPCAKDGGQVTRVREGGEVITTCSTCGELSRTPEPLPFKHSEDTARRLNKTSFRGKRGPAS